MIYIGADHGGFDLKEIIKRHLSQKGLPVTDMGAETKVPDDDYVDYALKVAESIALAPTIRSGILVCRSGVGVSMAANKIPGLRAALVATPEQAKAAKEDDHANVLALAADYTDEKTALEIIDAWLEAEYSDDLRHRRRLDKLATHEEQAFNLNYMPR